eukprot:6236307-Pyramimonas_sp.AAC.2
MARMTSLIAVLKSKKGFGALSVKNVIEVLRVHNILANISLEETSKIPDGPGAAQFWRLTKISRDEMVAYLKDTIQNMKDVALRTGKKPVAVSLSTGKTVEYDMNQLGFEESSVDHALAQYWSCAQSRILAAYECVSRGAERPIPYHLLPNKRILEIIAGLSEFADSESSDDSVEDEE